MTAICEGREDKKIKDPIVRFGKTIERQAEQIIIMIKSAAVMTSTFVKFIIVVNKDNLYDSILREINSWPGELLQKFSIEKRYVIFPPGSPLKSLFKECATARLFFPEQFLDIDKALYIDTDVVFLRPPEELWSEFNHFNDVQLSGFSPELTYYDPSQKVPYYGETGLNTGVWLMHLERLREFPGGWINKCKQVYEKYNKVLLFGDQGIVNIIFNEVPHFVYEIGCHWNFRFHLCNDGNNVCKESQSKGIHLLHGSGMSFFKNREPRFMAVYEVWKNFDPKMPLSVLLKSLKMSLENATEGGLIHRNCLKVPGINFILIKALQEYVDSIH